MLVLICAWPALERIASVDASLRISCACYHTRVEGQPPLKGSVRYHPLDRLDLAHSGHRRDDIADKYRSLEEVVQALRQAGLESSNLIIGIDYTKSNEYTGQYSFGGRCLHAISHQPIILNPYQHVISVLGRTLESFDDDKLIPCFGFGDSRTTNVGVFPFYADRVPHTFQEILYRYNEITPLLTLAGPTNFAPLIYEAINITRRTKSYHILVIIADGQVTNEDATRSAIVEASHFPLSIVMVGVGDGPWDQQKKFDDKLSNRKFDNFQFVAFSDIMRQSYRNPEAAFAMHALMEIPSQFLKIKKLGMLG